MYKEPLNDFSGEKLVDACEAALRDVSLKGFDDAIEAVESLQEEYRDSVLTYMNAYSREGDALLDRDATDWEDLDDILYKLREARKWAHCEQKGRLR